MRVLILSPGTRGDVAPATGLGAAFVADGHQVTIVANAEYESLVTGAGCALAPITMPVTPPSPTAGEDAQGVRAYLATRTYMDHAATAALAATPGAEVVLTNAISPYGHDIAEHLGVPSAEALLQPSHPSGAYPPMIAAAKTSDTPGAGWPDTWLNGPLAARPEALRPGGQSSAAPTASGGRPPSSPVNSRQVTAR
jgi:sterol 3beta-glucosyltransferase